MRFCEHCHTKPVFGTDKNTRTGYCKSHQYLRTDISKESILQRAVKKQRENVAKQTQSKLKALSYESDDNREAVKGYAELDRWFKEVRKSMTGVCQNCGGKTCKDNDKEYKRSIAHILQKAYFKSVATHPDNFLELCFYGNSCHTNLDNGMIDLIEMNCFDTIIQKFTKIYPHIAQEEKRRIPSILIEYLKTEL